MRYGRRLPKTSRWTLKVFSIISLKTRRRKAGRNCWKDCEQMIIQLWNPLDNQGSKVV